MAGLDPGTKINLAKASVMVMESNQHAADMLNQILKGFGVGEVYRCTTVAESLKVISTNTIDLIVADPKLRDGDAFEILYELRHSKTEPVCYVPVIILSGHSTSSQVKSSRDIGANFFIAKPVSPSVLLERVMWVVRDRRPFVEVSRYIGPDRRFKEVGPPKDGDGRRLNDDAAEAEAAQEPQKASV